MKQVTVFSLRWPYALMAILMVVPVLLPSTYMVVAASTHLPGAFGPDGTGLWMLVLIAMTLWAGWASLCVVPMVRPRRLILDEHGVTLDTFWRRRHWAWDRLKGLWPLGGYKPHLEVEGAGGKPERVFLGSYWPGDTAGLMELISEYRAGAQPTGLPR